MIESYDLEFCTIEIYEDHTIAMMKEGVVVSPKHVQVFSKIVNKHYKNKPFVYISKRINSYSVNPITHIKSSKISNLVALAVVSNDPKQQLQTKIEKPFFERDFCHFHTIEEALVWKDEIIKKHSSCI